MNKMINALAFFSGVAVGSAATWYYIKEKYARIAEEEINSVKEVYANHDQKLTEDSGTGSENASKILDKPSLTEYARRVRDEGYTEYSHTVVGKETPTVDAAARVITPDEFGEIEEYAKISLSYFADGVLADDDNEPIDDVEEIVGDALSHFGEYEEDAVFVRNDAKKCDYEILMDTRNFKDVLEDLPPRRD